MGAAASKDIRPDAALLTYAAVASTTSIVGLWLLSRHMDNRTAQLVAAVQTSSEKETRALRKEFRKGLKEVSDNVGHIAERTLTAKLCSPDGPFKSVTGPNRLRDARSWVQLYFEAQGIAPDEEAINAALKALCKGLANAELVRGMLRWVGRTMELLLGKLQQARELPANAMEHAQKLKVLGNTPAWLQEANESLGALVDTLRPLGLKIATKNLKQVAAAIKQALRQVSNEKEFRTSGKAPGTAATPEGAGASTPEGAGASTPEGTAASTPEGAGASTPEGTAASTPEGAGASTPEGTATSSPEGAGASTLEVAAASTLKGAAASTPEGAAPSTRATPPKLVSLRGLFASSNSEKGAISEDERTTPKSGPQPGDGSGTSPIWEHFDVRQVDAAFEKVFKSDRIITALLHSMFLGPLDTRDTESKKKLHWEVEIDSTGILKENPADLVNIIEAKTSGNDAATGKEQLARARKMFSDAARLINRGTLRVGLWLCVLRFTGDLSPQKLQGMVPPGDDLFHAAYLGNGNKLTVLPSGEQSLTPQGSAALEQLEEKEDGQDKAEDGEDESEDGEDESEDSEDESLE